MKYNWHREVLKKVIHSVAKHAAKLMEKGISFEGWYEWFEKTYPDVWKKYIQVESRINTLWGKMDDKSMEEFKELCRQYETTERWVLDKFAEEVAKEANQG